MYTTTLRAEKYFSAMQKTVRAAHRQNAMRGEGTEIKKPPINADARQAEPSEKVRR
jgi:hypothetical protein